MKISKGPLALRGATVKRAWMNGATPCIELLDGRIYYGVFGGQGADYPDVGDWFGQGVDYEDEEVLDSLTDRDYELGYLNDSNEDDDSFCDVDDDCDCD